MADNTETKAKLPLVKNTLSSVLSLVQSNCRALKFQNILEEYDPIPLPPLEKGGFIGLVTLFKTAGHFNFY